ncbi:MAG: putative 2-dehydropantoate 2-reductase [Pirellulales bacterium]|nr:putative 2-dehydropantoate 2-reductase [Pirellulales bacterium]
MNKRRYAIIGTGALGGLYGGMLARAGQQVHFLFRNDYEHVCQHGLRVESPWGDFHLPQVHAHRSADTLPPCDVTIIALKTTRNDLLGQLLSHCTRGEGVVLVLQNGLDVEADSAAVVGADRVLGGCCFLCSNKVGPGHIRHLDYGRIVFGEYQSSGPGVSSRAEAICRDLVEAGIDAHTTDDLLLTRWRKLLWNITFNGLSVALNASTKQLIENPDSLALCESLVKEVHGGAACCGIEMPAEMMTKTIDNTRTMVPYDSSMRLDYLSGRPMEIESIFGNPLRAVAARGGSMPRVEMLYRQLQFLDAANVTSA